MKDAASEDMKNSDCTVLVCSCDKYVDVLGPFAQLWRRFWPDCPFETVLVTETLAPDGFDRVVLAGRGRPWCENLCMALKEIATPYVLMLMDDYYLGSPVDSGLVLRRLAEAKKFGAASLRLNPVPPGLRPWPGSDLLEMPKDAAYCVTCQTSIWNREFLLGLAARNKSAWEFERHGSFMVGGEKRPLLVAPTKEFPFVDAVHKGYWEKFGLAVCRDNGIDMSGTKRTLPPVRIRLVEGLKSLVFRMFPWNWIVRVQNSFGLGAKESDEPDSAIDVA